MRLRWAGTMVCVCAASLATGGGVAPAAAQQADSVRALSLDDALQIAEGQSEDIRIAETGVSRAHGQQMKVRSQYLPQISGSLSYTRTLRSVFQDVFTGSDSSAGPPACSTFHPDPASPLEDQVRVLESALGCAPASGFGGLFSDFSSVGFGSANEYNLGLSLTQNLFAGGRVRAQVRQAGAARETAEITLTSARAQVMLQVTQAYYDAALGDSLVAIAEATLAQADTTLAQTRLAHAVGNQAEFDLLRAQVTRNNQVPVVIQRRSARDLAYMRLKQALSLPLEERLALTTLLGDTGEAASARLASLFARAPDTAALERAPVREADQAVVADRAALTVAKAQRIPLLTLSSQFGRVAYPNGGFPDWSAFRSNWTITGAIQVPLFTGGGIRGDEIVAEANLHEAEARQRQTQQLTALDTRDAVSQLEAAEAQFAANQGTVEQAVKAYQIAQLRYREGISTQTELTDSRIALQQARANRAQSARDLQVARVRFALLHDLPNSAAGVTSATSSPGVTSQPAQTLTVPPATRPGGAARPGAGGTLAVQTNPSGVSP